MTVHVDEMETSVLGEPSPAAAAGDGGSDEGASRWARMEQARAMAERARRDAARTAAEDFDD